MCAGQEGVAVDGRSKESCGRGVGERVGVVGVVVEEVVGALIAIGSQLKLSMVYIGSDNVLTSKG